MNKISKRNKAKATAILASIVWGATVLTGCPGPVTPEIEQPTYPESVADSEMNALKENTIANVRANLDAIYNILSAHKNEEGVSAYITKLNEVKSAIDSLTDLTNADNVADYTKTITLGTEDTSLTEYATALEKKTDYETYRDGDFKTARDAYITAIKAVPTENYNNLLAEGVKVVADFMDDKIFNQSEEAYDVENIKSLSTAAKNDQAGISDEKATYDAAYNTVDGKYTTAQNAVNAYNTAHENSVAYQKAHPTITSETDIANIDWASVEGVKVAVANGSTEIDVLTLRELYDSVRTAATENGKEEGIVDFAAYPASAETFVIKNNLELMAKAGEPDYSDAEKDTKFELELIPGINVYANVAKWDDNTNYLERALKFTDTTKKVDLSSTSYNLGDYFSEEFTYNGGIIGDVEFENLAKTKISGMIFGKSHISPFYEKFIEKTDVENLPELTLNFKSKTADMESDVSLGETGDNLYGSNLDKIISSYYNNSKTMTFSSLTALNFNAKDYLNGGSMYEENGYVNSAYELDINALLVINPSVSNVNIVGTNYVGSKELAGNMTNVRFESDLNGVSLTGSERGVIEFAGLPPEAINPGGRTIFKKMGEYSVAASDSFYSVDVSVLTTSAAAKITTDGDSSRGIGELITNEAGASPSGFSGSPEKTVVGASNSKYSNEDFEKAGNEGRILSDLLSSITSKNINQTRSDLIRAILDDNQKQYS